MPKRLTKEEFIEKAKKIHGEKYDYSKVDYVNNHTKVCIICPKHGEFWQKPNPHLCGKGCAQCANEKQSFAQQYNTNDFIEKAKIIHNNKYDYSHVNYISSHDKVEIICPTHGIFWQRPNSHLQMQGCPKCGIIQNSTKQTKNINDFIKESKKIHGEKYDYSKVKYVNNHTKVQIICPTHGEFWQTPKHHIRGHGCGFCTKRFRYTNEEYIKLASKIHNNKYDYSKTNYTNSHDKITITCPKHGDFLQSAYMHLQGNGCPNCNNSRLEEEIELLLKNNSIEYINRYSPDWLGQQHLDFYIPDYNIAIECQGIQHYETVRHFGGQDGFEKRKQRDKLKEQICKENGVKLLYFTHYRKINEEDNVYKDKDNLLKRILYG